MLECVSKQVYVGGQKDRRVYGDSPIVYSLLYIVGGGSTNNLTSMTTYQIVFERLCALCFLPCSMWTETCNNQHYVKMGPMPYAYSAASDQPIPERSFVRSYPVH